MKQQYLGLEIDLSRDNLFSPAGLSRLKEGYMLDSETSPQHRFAYVSKAFGTNDAHAQRLYEYSSKMWLSYATPVLSYGKTKRSLPISCFADGTLVNTDRGHIPIDQLVIGDVVLSHDGDYHPITDIVTSDSDDVYELTINEESFFVTGNHLVLTTAGEWVRVDALDPDVHDIAQVK